MTVADLVLNVEPLTTYTLLYLPGQISKAIVQGPCSFDENKTLDYEMSITGSFVTLDPGYSSYNLTLSIDHSKIDF